MARAKKAQRGKPCPRCGSTVTRQLINWVPMKGRYRCFGCKRTWDENPGHESYADHVVHIRKGGPVMARAKKLSDLEFINQHGQYVSGDDDLTTRKGIKRTAQLVRDRMKEDRAAAKALRLPERGAR